MNTIQRLGLNSCLAVALFLSMSHPAQAANATWNGNSGTWTTGTNWTGGVVPGATSGTTNTDTATINNGGSTISLPTGENIQNITFGGNALSNGLSGGSLLIGNSSSSGTIQLSSTLNGAGRQEVIYSAMTLEGTVTLVNNSGAPSNNLDVMGNINTNGNALILDGTDFGVTYFNNTGNNFISGNITGTGNLTKNGTGIWTLTGTSSLTGATTVNGGILVYKGSSTFGVTSAVTVNSGATVALYGGGDTYAGTTGTQTLTISGGGAGGVYTPDLNGQHFGAFAAFEADSKLTYAGGINLAADASIAGADGALTLTGTVGINTNGHILTLLTESPSPGPASIFIGDVISGSGGIVRNQAAGSGAVTLGAQNTYTGSTTLDNGTLALAFNRAGVTNNIIANTATNTLILHGGTFTLTGTVAASTNDSQSFSNGGTTIGSGSSAITITGTQSTSGVALNLGAITHNTGGTVDFTQPTSGGGTISSTNGYLATGTSNDAGGIIGGYATVAGNDWATLSSGNIVAYSAYTNDTWSTGANVTVTTNTTQTNATANTLRFNAPGVGTNQTVTLSGTNILTDGGILVTANVGNHSSNIKLGTLEGSSGGDLDIIDNNATGTTAVLNITSTIADNGSATGLTKSGSGTLVLSGANTYTGVTTLNGGPLNLGSASALGGSSSLVINGGVLDNTTGSALNIGTVGLVLNNDFYFTGTNSLTIGGTVSLGTQPGSERKISVGASTLTLSGVISNGTGTPAPSSLAKIGAGTLILSGLNTYTGQTMVDGGGILAVTSLQNGGTAGTFGASSNAASNLIIRNGTIQYIGTSAASTDRLFSIANDGTSQSLDSSGGGAVSFTNSGDIAIMPSEGGSGAVTFTLTGTNTGNNVFDPVLTDFTPTGPLTLRKSGVGTWDLGGANTFTGETIISSGTLVLTNYNALQNSAFVASSSGTAVLAFNAGTGGTYTLGGLVGTSTGTLNLVDVSNHAITLQIGNNNNTTNGTANITGNTTYSSAFGGVLSDVGTSGSVGSNIVKVGTGGLTLSGTNTYTGSTTISAGTLFAGAAVSSASGPFGNSSSAIILGDANTTANNSSATLLNNGFAISRNITVSNNATSGTYSIGGNTNGSSTYSGTITLNQNLTISQAATSGTDALNLTGGVTSGGGNEMLTFAGPGSINVNTSAITNGTGTLSVNVTGGTTTFTTQNTYTGTTGVGGGNLLLDFNQVASPSSNIVNASSRLVLGGGTVTVNGKTNSGSSQTFNGLTINAGASSLVESTTGTSGSVAVTLGAITRNTGGTVNFFGPVTTTTGTTNGILGGYATVNGTDWATVNSGNIVAYSGYTNDTWAAGNNTTVTTSSSPTSGSTSNSLRFNAAGADTVTLAGTNILTSGGILETVNVGANNNVITGGTLVGSSGGDLIIQQNNTAGTLTISGTIADNGTPTGLTKSGAGTLILSPSTGNTYTGNTYLNGGVTISGNASAFGPSGTIHISGGAELAAQGIGGAAQAIANPLSIDGNASFGDSANSTLLAFTGGITLTNNAILNIVNGTPVDIKSSIGDGGHGYGITKTGAGTLEFGSSSTSDPGVATYTGATTINGGTIALYVGAANYINLINPNSTLVLGGGTLSETFSSTTGAFQQSQTFNGLTLNAGASAISSTATSGVGGGITLGAITRNVGSTLNITTLNSSVSTSTTYGTGVIGYITIGGNAFASNGLGTASPTTVTTSIGANGTGYYSITAAATVGGGTGAINPSALQFSTAAASSLTLNGTVNIITSGGILETTAATVSNSITGGTLTSGNGTDLIVIQNNSGTPLTIGSVIADNVTPIALTKSGAGTLILSGANTYSGPTYLNGGIIQVGSSSALGSSANLIFGSSTTTSGIFNLNGNNITLGGLNSSASIVGTPKVEAAATGFLTGTLTVNNTGNSTFAGVLTDGSGVLNVVKSGTGTLVLSGTNTYSGTTAINQGTVVLNGGGSMDGTALTVSGSNTTVSIGGNYTMGASVGGFTSAPLTFNAGTVLTLVDGTINTLTFGTNASSVTLNSTTLNFEIGGTADQILFANPGTFSGSGNIINLTELGTLTGTSQILIQGIGTGILGDFTLATTTLGGYTLSLSNVGSNLVLNESMSITPTTAYYNGLGSDLNAAGNFDTTVSGTVLTAATATGTTNVYFSANRNTLTAASTSSALSVNSLNFGVGSGTNSGITLSGTSAITITGSNVNGTTGNQGITTTGTGSDSISAPLVLAANQTWSVDTGGTLTVSGTVSGGSSALTKAGAGKLVLSGNNTYSGGTTLSTGTLVLGTSTAGSTTITSGPVGTGTLTLASGSTLQDNGTAITLANAVSVSGTITFSSTGAGSLTFDGRNLTSPSVFTLTGNTILIVNNTTTIDDNIAGNFTLTKQGNGTLNLLGTSSSTAGTTITSGSITIANGASLGSGLISLANGTGLTYTGGAGTIAQNITVASGATGTVSNTGTATLTLAGTLTKADANLILNAGGHTIDVTGAIVSTGATGTFDSDLYATNGTIIADNSNNSYSGPTHIYGNGTLVNGFNNALPTSTVIELGNSGGPATETGASYTNIYQLNGHNQSIAGLTSANPAGFTDSNHVIGGSATLSTLTLTGTASLGEGILGGTGSNANNLAVKFNPGSGKTITLSGSNTYTGGTEVVDGNLLVNNTTGSATGGGTFKLDSGAGLSGTGTITSTSNTVNGNVTVGSGGTNTTDVLTMTASGTTTFSGANLTFNLDANSTNSNVMALGSTPSIYFGSGVTTLTLNLLGTGSTNIANGTDYILFTASSASDYKDLTFSGSKITNFVLTLTGTASNGAANSLYYGQSYLILSGNNIEIQVVPEPGTWALMLGGLALLVAFQRIRRSHNG